MQGMTAVSLVMSCAGIVCLWMARGQCQHLGCAEAGGAGVRQTAGCR